jgi:N-acetylglucosaminyl-diphospho-decaprenol L-rhamnosyltransferase
VTAPDVSVITVSHNVRDLVLRSVAALEREREKAAIELLLVDSASSDGTPEAVAAAFPWVRVLPSRENLGFTGGNNRGMRIARGRHVLLLNPDAEVRPGAIARMAAYLDANPDVGAVGPRLLWPDGSIQPSRRRFPSRLTGFVESTVLQRWLGGATPLQWFYMADEPEGRAHDVDWLVGACLMVRGEVVRRVGVFDDRFFMYSEEVDLCRRIKSDGWRIVYLPDAEVVHHEGKSSEQNLTTRDLRFHESRFLYYAKHHGRGWSLLLRLATLGNFVFVAAEEAAKWLLRPASRPLRQRRLKSHGTVLARQSRQLLRAALGRA